MNTAFLILVTLLGADSFKVREAAHVSLARADWLAVDALLAGERSPCQETARRCEAMLNDLHKRHAVKLADAAEPLTGWPWMDCGGLDDPLCYETRSHYMYAARSKLDWTEPFWFASSEATRMLVIDRIAARQPWRHIVARLRAGHIRYCESLGILYGIEGK